VLPGIAAMKAIILAAGRGERMRPLTDTVPKALLRAGGRCLIEWQIVRLVKAGFRELVINVCHLGEQIESALGCGARLGARIEFSREPVALETAGGIAQALTRMDGQPFIAVNADIYCEYDYARLHDALAALARPQPRASAHLVLVDNPPHHPQGDFALAAGAVSAAGSERLTFSGIGAYRPDLFAGIRPGERCALGPMLHRLAHAGALRGEHYAGPWMDIGTPERLRELQDLLAGRPHE
jgi:MurNAc alpha-1-phosphate uridylyltransferase